MQAEQPKGPCRPWKVPMFFIWLEAAPILSGLRVHMRL